MNAVSSVSFLVQIGAHQQLPDVADALDVLMQNAWDVC